MGIFAVPSPSRKPFRFFNAWKGAPGVPVRSMQVRLMVGIDIQNFSGRNAEMQDAAQFDLLRALTAAAAATGIDPRRWTLQPGGDGALIVLPEGLDYARIVGRLPGNLERALARLDRPGPRLRLRLAVHYGFLVRNPATPFGPAGDAPVLVSRLLDSEPLRRQLAGRPDRDLALMVSDDVYWQVVRSGLCDLRPDDFRPVDMTIKDQVYRGHVHDPDR